MIDKSRKQASFQSALGGAVICGLLLGLGWPPLPFAFVLIIAFVPLFVSWEFLRKRGDSAVLFWLVSYVALLIWNVFTTWWVAKSTLGGGIFANMVNPLLMTLPLLAYRYTRNKLGDAVGWISLIAYWVLFEYLHMQWELTWSWLNLGNGFAVDHSWIQWYEFTGVLGGTVWILVINILIYTGLQKLVYYEQSLQKRFGLKQRNASRYAILMSISKPLVVILIPLIISLIMYYSYTDRGFKVEVVAVQPNYEPHHEKFSIPSDVQLHKMMQLSDSLIGPKTDYVLWPETSITEMMFLDELDRDKNIREIRAFRSSHPRLKVITGVNGYMKKWSSKEANFRARAYPRANRDTLFLESFNSAIQVGPSAGIEVYNKGKLVPGPEVIPFYKHLRFLEKVAVDLPGLGGNLIASQHRSVFHSDDTMSVAPVICYESIYGEFLTGYIKQGAQLIFVVTNDGWWGNTAGHKQHNLYAKLRAIESRRSLARSANTGTSSFINQRGDITQKTNYGEEDVIKGQMAANDKRTYYVLHGDYIGRTAIWLSIGLLLLSFVSAQTNFFAHRVNRL